MKAKDLRERSQDDLKELEKSLAKDTFTARFKNFTNRLDDTSTINKTKRDLARVKTLLRQAELNAASSGSTAAPAAKAEAAAPKAATKKTAAKKASKSEAK
jgi:large subunit ribosomal protein L29